MGFAGKNPKVRHLGISDSFQPGRNASDPDILENYNLTSGYILILGNGLPHKNLGALLEISSQINRGLLFVGVLERNQKYWQSKYPAVEATWIRHLAQRDLPAIVRNGFCLAQPSTAEGYGYPPLEAMACGVPAIVSDIPVLTETTGGHALTAHPHKPKTWLQAIRALENKENYQTQAQRGLEWVEPLRGRNGWNKHVSDLERLMR
jgi:glycosyltransferase involved in cell wall biosynthesis